MIKLFNTVPAGGGYREIPMNFTSPDGRFVGSAKIPVCATTNGHIIGIYYTGSPGYELCMSGITAGELDSYLDMLSGDFAVYAVNEINGNRFFTLTGADAHLSIAYYPTFDNTLRTVISPAGYLPPLSAAPYTRVADTFINQIARHGADQRAPGMSYIIQLADGRFIIVDGGGADERDEQELIEYLEENTKGADKPDVAAWFITHSHADHMALANEFIEKYHDRFTVELAAYNFPTYDAVKWCFDVNANELTFPLTTDGFISRVRKYWPEAGHFIFHTGQKLYLADVEIEILFTHEDLFPTAMPWINHTSSAFRLTTPAKSVFFTGDCEKTLCNQMVSCYGSSLKSDILQVCHHGANGASVDFYRLIDPDICLWPCPEVMFNTDVRQLGTKPGYEFNAYLRDDSVKHRLHCHNSASAVIML